jgi:hypothetical protein
MYASQSSKVWGARQSWPLRARLALVSCRCLLGVIALACGPTDAEKSHFADQCKAAAPTEQQGWFDTKFSAVEFKTLPPNPRVTDSESTFVAVSKIRGRGVDGAFRSAQFTCSGFGQATVTASIGEMATEPISNADREWLHRQILEKASAAAGAQRYSEAVLLLKGKGDYKADTSQWLKTEASYKTLLASALKEEAKLKKAAVARLKAEARENAALEKAAAKEQVDERRQTAEAADTRYTTKASFGCTSQSEYLTLVGIAASGNTDGLATALTLAALADECTTFHGGEAVYVVGRAGGTELVQIRFKGRGPHSWWISDTFLR